MILELEALTDIEDVFIDYIEIDTPDGVISIDWDSSDILRTSSGFQAVYRGVYFNDEYANGQIHRLKKATVSAIQLYSEEDIQDSHFEINGCLDFCDGLTNLSIPVNNRDIKIFNEGDTKSVKIAVTGHRPKKLWGYDLNHPKYCALKRKMQEILIEKKCTEAITGMALGVDTIYALAVLELKDQGQDIKLHCAIPCKEQSSRWPGASREIYQNILGKADKVSWVSRESYRPELMYRRNCFMVDEADLIIAVWNGENSGTGNCVSYAQSRNKEVIYINPDLI